LRKTGLTALALTADSASLLRELRSLGDLVKTCSRRNPNDRSWSSRSENRRNLGLGPSTRVALA